MTISYIETPYTATITSRLFKLQGWVAQNESIDTIHLLINGQKFDFLFCYMREDVVQNTGNGHAVGWVAHLEVARYAVGGLNSFIVELFVNDRKVETLHFRHDPMPGRNGPLTYFVHIPKTAGTSTEEALKNAPSLRLLAVNKDMADLTLDQFTTLSTHVTDDVDLVHGHFPYGVHRARRGSEGGNRGHKYITVIRRPESHMLSCYYYMKVVVQLEGFNNGASIFENLASSPDPSFDNYMTRYLSGAMDAKKITNKHFDMAMANIENDFLYIGTVEDYHNALTNVGLFLGANLKPVTENQTPYVKEREELSADILATLVERHAAYDLKLYEAITQRFQPDHWQHHVSTIETSSPQSQTELARPLEVVAMAEPAEQAEPVALAVAPRPRKRQSRRS